MTQHLFSQDRRCPLLILHEDAVVSRQFQELAGDEFATLCVSSIPAANAAFDSQCVGVLLAPRQLSGQSTAILLDSVARKSPSTVRILLTRPAEFRQATEAINSGRVHRVLFEPFSTQEAVNTVRHCARQFLLERSHELLLEELRELTVELENKVQQRTLELEHANRQLQQRNSMLTKMALTDPLTGLPNRRAMDRLAKTELIRRARYPSAVAIGLIDIDDFKKVNSDHHLSGGDHALSWLGQMLAGAVRNVDTVGRVGGEEFMVVAPETDSEGAWILAERMRTTVASGSTRFASSEIRLTISVGFAVADGSVPCGYDQLRHTAASALTCAKMGGKNSSVITVLPATGSRRPAENIPTYSD